MKKITTMLIAILFIITLSACNIQEDPTAENTQPTNTTAETDAKTNTTEENNAEGSGGTALLCPIHHDSYHSFDGYLIDLVGEDAFMEWIDDTTGELFEQQADVDECYLPEQTIHTFIEHFDISRSTFEDMYYNYRLYEQYICSPELLFEGTNEEVDNYFRNIDGLKALRSKYASLSGLKLRLVQKNEEKFNELYPTNQSIVSISLYELITALEIDRDELESEIEAGGADAKHFDYNLNLIYPSEGAVSVQSTLNLDQYNSYELDAMICGSEFTPD